MTDQETFNQLTTLALFAREAAETARSRYLTRLRQLRTGQPEGNLKLLRTVQAETARAADDAIDELGAWVLEHRDQVIVREVPAVQEAKRYVVNAYRPAFTKIGDSLPAASVLQRAIIASADELKAIDWVRYWMTQPGFTRLSLAQSVDHVLLVVEYLTDHIVIGVFDGEPLPDLPIWSQAHA